MKLYKEVLEVRDRKKKLISGLSLDRGRGPILVGLVLAAEQVEILADIRDALQKIAKIQPREEGVDDSDRVPFK